MTELYLVPVMAEAPVRLRHRPTEVRAMQFTRDTRYALYEWLAADLGREHFEMTDTQLVIETTQGDSRDVGLYAWVLERPTRRPVSCLACIAAGRNGCEFYPVEKEVVEDDYFVPRGAA